MVLIMSEIVKLGLTTINNLGLDGGLDLASAATGGLEFLDHLHALGIGNLAKDDMLAIQPGSDNGSDEELRAVASGTFSIAVKRKKMGSTNVLGPALAMESKPSLTCFRWKFSSANFSP